MTRFVFLALSAALLAANPAAAATNWEALPALKRDCSTRSDPKDCEERKANIRAAIKTGRASCKGQVGDAHDECMGRHICAKGSEPQQCEADLRKARSMLR